MRPPAPNPTPRSTMRPVPSRRGLLLLLAAAVTTLTGCHKKADTDEENVPAVEVHCEAASRAAFDVSIVLRGRTAPPPGGDLPVASQVAGRVLEIRVKEGQRVTRGALVAIVDDLGPRAAATQADAAVARSRSAEAAAIAALERTKDLAAKGIAARRDVEDAIARADAARAGVEADVAALRFASGTLRRVDVLSTFDGVVTKVWRGAGALVDGSAATPIIQLASVGTVEFVADVTERDLALVKEGQKASIALASGGDVFAGTVLARSRSVDPATGLGVVRLQIDGPAEPAPEHETERADGGGARGAPGKPSGAFERPVLGAYGKAIVLLDRRDAVLSIPSSALRGAVADGAEIAICGAIKTTIRAVKVGFRDAARVEVLEGLKDSEEVAIDHVLGLEDGTRIVRAEDDEDGGKPPGGKDDAGVKDDKR